MDYYAVRWGETIRVSSKVDGPARACLDCYGICTDDMEFKNLGSNKTIIQSNKLFTNFINSNTQWVKIEKVRKLIPSQF